MADIATEQLPLRERKKLRTRQALIDTALDLFTERGFDNTTLDELCEAVEISKRTFFRNFSSKEAVAMAPLQDMWAAFLRNLEHRECRGITVLEMLQDALISTVEAIADDGWTQRAARSHRLAQDTPSMGAHNLQFCDQTSRNTLVVLRRMLDLGDDSDVRPRLALDILIAAFHCALDTWTSHPAGSTTPTLTADLRQAFAATPGALTMTAKPRIMSD
ncbi:TetR/AcrR family transcriptional regulator [Nocardia carnea]|uniref:TetR/AcrR family transcriptional regulator n=1 Tax=Nocardia carnea TaxID=37328 RepID=UPI002457E8AE|nr:TetR family transcriptional regulator [Nocardia carnea]